MRNRPETVTASDVAEFVYCPEAWRLKELGHRPTNQRERNAGTIHHARKALVERLAGGFIAFGRILILLAILAMALMWWLRR